MKDPSAMPVGRYVTFASGTVSVRAEGVCDPQSLSREMFSRFLSLELKRIRSVL